MAALLDTEEKARRLARAILNDITLYNEDRILASSNVAEDLADAIGAGRSLFRDRVAAPLASVLEQETAEWTAKMNARADRAPRPAAHPPTRERERVVVEGGERAGGKGAATIAVVVGAGIVGYFLMR